MCPKRDEQVLRDDTRTAVVTFEKYRCERIRVKRVGEKYKRSKRITIPVIKIYELHLEGENKKMV